MSIQHEKNQTAPAFVKWLGEMDSAVQQFLTVDAPEIGALADTYGPEALIALTGVIRARFADVAALADPDNAATVDRYVRYLGQVLVTRAEGSWANVPDNSPAGTKPRVWPVVREPYRTRHFDPYEILALAFVRGTKRLPLPPQGEIAVVVERSLNEFAWWTRAGRPTGDTLTAARIAHLANPPSSPERRDG